MQFSGKAVRVSKMELLSLVEHALAGAPQGVIAFDGGVMSAAAWNGIELRAVRGDGDGATWLHILLASDARAALRIRGAVDFIFDARTGTIAAYDRDHRQIGCVPAPHVEAATPEQETLPIAA